MPELGFIVYLVAISYALGLLWYTLLGHHHTSWMRIAAFPLLAVVIGEALWTRYLATTAGQGLVFSGLNLYVALVATFIGALVDIGLTWLGKEYPVGGLLHPLRHRHQPTGQ